ncbi:RNA polymerase sigma factor [Dyadobacter luticola]|uniref:RNA polymerase sigma factor n=1 Tax=Dyadobacter luticola TaxID=1979387 RepID=A0A5R9KZJ7_9BACT|nr:RNA polymerase sigma factor [Dyadobacter luticola]TLV01525.1 RNA polymerase sigma factor [Dyadobacter luticola]
MALFKSKKHHWELTELVEACQKQDSRAQVAFYDRYKSKLLGVCLRYARTVAEAEDIFQEGILKIFTKIKDIQNPQTIDSWVKTIMIRHAIDYYNQVTRKETLSSNLEDSKMDWESGDHLTLPGKLDVNVLLETINELPDGYRIVINLHFVDGYKHSEIADLLGIKEASSRSQLSKGRNLLIKKLEQKGITQHELL